jgi:carboxyl-terminal processing protease
MKKITILLVALVAGAMTFQSCEDLDDNAVPVNDFIWKGLNAYYLWQEKVPNLADDRFANQKALYDFTRSYDSPESLFESLLYRVNENGQRVDRFSVIFPDYRVLENALQGVSKSNGMEYGLAYTDDSRTTVVGYVRYIMPDSDAAGKDIRRGDIFYAVNNTPITESNYRSLLNNDTYTLNLATISDGVVTPGERSVTLNATQFSENPVHLVTTVTRGSHTVGYLMYNGFYSNYDAQLNAAFAELQAANVTDLVLDLRYNGGGSVRTATYLASMITGQFDGQILAKQRWNDKLQAKFERENPSALHDLFSSQLSDGSAINSLGLTKVYVLTSGSTASASELVINCLKPYINVVQIGDTTTGKNVGSVTLYDSRDFGKEARSGSHTYAMQPIVIKTVNKNNDGDYANGISPLVESNKIKENINNLGVLGDVNEPLFARALRIISPTGRYTEPEQGRSIQFSDSKSMRRFGTEMYIERMPENSAALIKDLR